MPLKFETFPCLSDNYGYLAHDIETGKTASIDAPDAQAIDAMLINKGWTLSDIFITHHHADHTDGIAALKEKYGAHVTGPRGEAAKINGLDRLVEEGDVLELGATKFETIATPGHTLGHICFFDVAGKNLFSADALFNLGCGRMFEGQPEPMWEGLAKLRRLPDETTVYCGHEYSQANAAFALSVDPSNQELQKLADEIANAHAQNQPTVPFNLGRNKSTNPFLRADDPAIAAAMNSSSTDAAKVFGALRRAKDNF